MKLNIIEKKVGYNSLFEQFQVRRILNTFDKSAPRCGLRTSKSVNPVRLIQTSVRLAGSCQVQSDAGGQTVKFPIERREHTDNVQLFAIFNG